ncbi:hypothetical protein BGZ72_001253, partial [Mortierella alpina]
MARAQYGAAPLTWDGGLYGGTLQHAQQCRFQHSNSGGQYGENLLAGTGNIDSKGAVDIWMREAAQYDYNQPGFSMAT